MPAYLITRLSPFTSGPLLRSVFILAFPRIVGPYLRKLRDTREAEGDLEKHGELVQDARY